MKTLALPLLFTLGACAAAPVDGDAPAAAPVAAAGKALTTIDTCQQDALRRVITLRQRGGSDLAARKALETAFATCLDPARTADNAAFLGAVNADYAHLASDFLAGRLSIAEYQAVLRDRASKQRALAADPAAQRALAAGDADGDMVPDASDRCPGTPYGLWTDAAGCTTAGPPVGDPGTVRQLQGSTVLYNPSCQGAPLPVPALPLAWGRGHQTQAGTVGFNLLATRSANQPAGCETLYEFDLRFTDPSVAGSPPVLHGHMVFRESEDLRGDPARVTFGLPLAQQLSPGRTTVRDAMNNYGTVSWRVRAVNGSQRASAWSAVVTQGPASGGVPG